MARKTSKNPERALADAAALAERVEAQREDAYGIATSDARQAMMDGWESTLTSLGSALGDKGASVTFSSRTPLSRTTLEGLYIQDWLMGAGVDEMAEECFREGFEVLVADNPSLQTALQDAIDETHYQATLRDALIWARVYGGALVWMRVNDGVSDDNLLVPLKEKHGGLVEMRVYDRWWAWPLKPPYDKPPAYRIMDPFLMRLFEVDASRVLRFDGARVPPQQRLANLGWGGSHMERPFEATRNFQASHAASTSLIQEYNVNLLKMRGLHEALMSPNGGSVVSVRAAAFQRGISIANMALVDKDGEEFSRVTARMAGLADVLDRQRDAAAGAHRTPVARLFGQQQGIRAGAQEDEQVYDRRVAAMQRDEVAPQVARLLDVLCMGRDGPTRGAPAKFQIRARPLRVLSDKEQSESALAQSKADALYIDKGVLRPIEVRKKFEGQTTARTITLDPKITKEMEQTPSEDPSSDPTTPPEPKTGNGTESE